MGRKRRRTEGDKVRIFCFYCDRDFVDQHVLANHQKEKHFRCGLCHKRLTSVNGLVIHTASVHKETVTAVPNAIDGRDALENDVFGMEGIPEWYWQSVNGNNTQNAAPKQSSNQNPVGYASAVPYGMHGQQVGGYPQVQPYGYPAPPIAMMPPAVGQGGRGFPMAPYAYTPGYYQVPPVSIPVVSVASQPQVRVPPGPTSSSESPRKDDVRHEQPDASRSPVESSVPSTSIPVSHVPPDSVPAFDTNGQSQRFETTTKLDITSASLPIPDAEAPPPSTGPNVPVSDTITVAPLPGAMITTGMVFKEDTVCMEEVRARLQRYAKFLPSPSSSVANPA